MSSRNSFLSIAAILAFAAAASAQVGVNYSFSQAAGAYVPITGGTQIAQGSTSNTMDDNTYPVTLPFAFGFDGASYTSINVQTNGWLSFGATAPGTQYTPLSSTAAVPGIVSAFGRDLQAGYVFSGTRTLGSDQLTNVNVSSNGPLQVGDQITGTGIATGATVLAIAGNVITMSAVATATSTNTAVTAYGPWSEMRYETQGVSPNQVFIVQWSGFRRFGTTLTTNQDLTLNFQVRLYESNGDIECVYGNCTPGVTTFTTTNQVGLRGPTNVFPANINNRLNTKGVNDDWINSVAGTTNASGMVFNNVAPANVITSGLTYKWTLPAGTPATNTSYGAGCGSSFSSAYQLFTTAASASAALSNTSLSMTNVGTGYLLAPGSAVYVTPSGTATSLTLGDDAETSVALSAAMPYPGGSASSLFVCSNGFVSAATGNGTGFTPSGAAFCNMTQAVWGCWHDFNPNEAGSGTIKFEEVGGIAYVTWENVESYPGVPTVNPGTMQLQFDVATGNVDLVFGLLDAIGGSSFGDNYLVGYSPAGANADPGSTDFATALPLVTGAADVFPLALSVSATPVLGTSIIYTTSNIPASALISADLISLGQINPGISVAGAPGCLQLVDLSLAATTLLIGSPSATLSFSVPNDAGLVGLPLNVQSASFVPGINPLNVITSNGIRSVVGNF